MTRVVIADNSADYRKSLLTRLRLEGYEVIEVESVSKASTALRAVRPDLALVDLRLTDDSDSGDMGGLEVAKAAREIDVPCIILSAFPSVEATRLALRSREDEPLAIDFVSKAEGAQALLDAINVVLEKVEGKEKRKERALDTSADRVAAKSETAFVLDKRLDLSLQQQRLLEYLRMKAGAPCTAQELLKAVYGEDVSSEDANKDERLPRLVARLREAIETEPDTPQRLLTVPNRGYVLLAK